MVGARSALDGSGPPQPVRARASIDVVVNQVLPGGWDTIKAIVDGLVALPRGDARQVRAFARLVEDAEAKNTGTAADAFRRHHT
jgi:hypothetical protein